MLHAAPPIAGGRYRLVARLGQGGMATVYRAWDRRLEVWRAIKVLHPSFAPNAASRARFEQEARTMARLRHPNVLAVHDVGDEGGQTYIVMALAPGGSLADRLAGGPLPARVAVRVIRDVLAGLQHAHDAGVVHRDIKPHNILLDADGTPLVGDFGIARVDAADMTRTGATIGTLAYMAPEQRGGARTADARADVYAAAGTLYALVTARDPHDLFVDGASTWEGVADALVPVLRKATRHDPAERHASARDLADALAAVEPSLPDTGTWDDGSLATSADTLDPPPPTSEGTTSEGTTSGGTSSATYVDDVPAHEVHRPTASPPPRGPQRPAGGESRLPWRYLGAGGLVVALLAAGVLATRPTTSSLPTSWSAKRLSLRDGAVDPATSVAVSPSGRVVWFMTTDGLWRQPIDGEPRRVSTDVPQWVELVALSDDEVIAASRADAPARRFTADGAATPLPFAGLPLDRSPDGRRLVVAEPSVLVTEGLDGGDRVVVDPSGGDASRLVRWSPDGRWLAIESVDGTDIDVSVLSIDGATRHRVVAGPDLSAMGQLGLAWWGDAVVYARGQASGSGRLLAQPLHDGVAAGDPVVLTTVDEGMPTAMASGGGRLAFLRIRSNGDAWRGAWRDGQLGDAERVTKTLGNDLPIGWLADGAVAWLTTSSSGDGVWVGRPGAEPERWSALTPSAAGSATTGDAVLAFVASGAGAGAGAGAKLVRIDGPGHETAVFDDPDAPWSVSCWGSACVGGRLRPGQLTLRRIDPATGPTGDPIATVSVEAQHNAPQISTAPGGHAVAIVEGGTAVAVVAEDGSLRAWPQPDCAVSQGLGWDADGAGLVFSCYDDRGWALKHLRLADGTVDLVRRSTGWIDVPRVSPDGGELLFIEDPLDSDVWTLAPEP